MNLQLDDPGPEPTEKKRTRGPVSYEAKMLKEHAREAEARFDAVPASDPQVVANALALRRQFQKLARLIVYASSGNRSGRIALTKLQEAAFFAVRATFEAGPK